MRVVLRSLLGAAGLGLVEVSIAMGLAGVLIAGIFAILAVQKRSGQNSAQHAQSLLAIQEISRLLADPGRCADALKAGSSAAQFPMGAVHHSAVLFTSQHLDRVVANGSDPDPSRWLPIVRVGAGARGLRLQSIQATAQSPYEIMNPAFGMRQFEINFEFRAEGSGLERSLGSQVFNRAIGLKVITQNEGSEHPTSTDPWRPVSRCTVFMDSGQAACEALGHVWEPAQNPPCRAEAGVFVSEASHRARILQEIQSLDGTLPSGIGTDDNIYAGRSIRSGQDVIAARDIRGRTLASYSEDGGPPALSAFGFSNGAHHPSLRFLRAQGDAGEPENIGVGDNGIIGGVYGSGWFGGDYRNSSVLRWVTDGAWSSNSYPTALEFFVARPGWRDFNDHAVQGADPKLSYGGPYPFAAMRVTSRANLEVGNEIHFGKHRLYAGIAPDSGLLGGGYIAVDGDDLEFGSQDAKLRHIAFYNRGLANGYHMDTSHGVIRSIGNKNSTVPKKASISLLSEDGASIYHYPARLSEVDDGQYYGPAELVIRKGGNTTAEAAPRFILNGNTLGDPLPGQVLTAVDGQGRAAWRSTVTLSCDANLRTQLIASGTKAENLAFALAQAQVDCSNGAYMLASIKEALWPSPLTVAARVQYICCK